MLTRCVSEKLRGQGPHVICHQIFSWKSSGFLEVKSARKESDPCLPACPSVLRTACTPISALHSIRSFTGSTIPYTFQFPLLLLYLELWQQVCLHRHVHASALVSPLGHSDWCRGPARPAAPGRRRGRPIASRSSAAQPTPAWYH